MINYFAEPLFTQGLWFQYYIILTNYSRSIDQIWNDFLSWKSFYPLWQVRNWLTDMKWNVTSMESKFDLFEMRLLLFWPLNRLIPYLSDGNSQVLEANQRIPNVSDFIFQSVWNPPIPDWWYMFMPAGQFQVTALRKAVLLMWYKATFWWHRILFDRKCDEKISFFDHSSLYVIIRSA